MIYRKNKLIVDGFNIDNLGKKYKTPIYCYSLRKITENIRNLKNKFKKLDPLFCYAVKANANLQILKELKYHDLGADVVSMGELAKALKAGIKPKKVVFSGIGKTSAEIEFAIKKNIDISFIEEMPLGDTAFSRKSTFTSNDEVLKKIKTNYLIDKIDYRTGGPAEYWQILSTKSSIGLISPHSHNFCEECNRVRISCKGELFLCLGQDDKIELMPLLREYPNNDQPIKDAILNSMKIKPKSHEFNLEQNKPAVVRFMSHTGG